MDSYCVVYSLTLAFHVIYVSEIIKVVFVCGVIELNKTCIRTLFSRGAYFLQNLMENP